MLQLDLSINILRVRPDLATKHKHHSPATKHKHHSPAIQKKTNLLSSFICIPFNPIERKTRLFWGTDGKGLGFHTVNSLERHNYMKSVNGITDSMDMSLGKLQEMLNASEAWHAAVRGVAKSQT